MMQAALEAQIVVLVEMVPGADERNNGTGRIIYDRFASAGGVCVVGKAYDAVGHRKELLERACVLIFC